MKDYKGTPALDAGLLAAAQAVEHYEMSRYGTLRTWAQELGLPSGDWSGVPRSDGAVPLELATAVL